ncbi:hypothetical protein J6A64_06085 [bacterium]|nr:hypothetical protein [bacterium]
MSIYNAVVNDIAGKKVYAEDRTLLNAVKLDIDSIGKIDGVGDMGVMMATLGSLKAPVTGLSFSASTKTGAFVNTLLQSSTSSAAMMYTYSTVVNTVNLYTNKTKNTQQDYKLLYKTVLNDTMWGAIGGLGNGLNACVKTSYISRSANQLAKKFYTPPSNFLLKAQRVGAGLGLATELGTDVLATYAINGDMSSLEFAQSLMTTLAGGAAVDDCFAKNIDMTTKRTFQMATFEQVSNKSYDEKIKYFTGYFESQGIPKDLATLMGTITTEKNFAKGEDVVGHPEVKISLTDVTIKDAQDNSVMKTPQESEVKVPVEGEGLKTPNRGEALIEMNNNLPIIDRFSEKSLDILIQKNVDPELVMDLLNLGYTRSTIKTLADKDYDLISLVGKMKTAGLNFEEQNNILKVVTQENIDLAQMFYSDTKSHYTPDEQTQILKVVTQENIDLAQMFYSDTKSHYTPDEQTQILRVVTQKNIGLAQILCLDPDFTFSEVQSLLRCRDDSVVPLVEKLYSESVKIPSQIKDILFSVTSTNLPFAEMLYDLPGFPTYQISKLLEVVNGDNLKFAMDLYNKCGLIDNGLDLIKLSKQLNDGVDDLSISDKIKLNEKLSALSPEVVKIFKSNGIDVDEIALRINESLNIKYDVVSVPKTQQHKFVQNILANNNPKADEVLKTFDFEQYGKDGLPLKYSREQFTANVNDLIKNLAPEEQNQILRHFGLIKGEAGFDGLPNNKEFNATDASPEVKSVADKVKQEIENFTMNNKVNTGDAEVDEVLNGLIQGFPEFTFIIGKKQHETHNYSVDIHTLKVLQDAMNNPLYKDLPDNDKTILKFSILCHDIAKKGGVRDEGHQNSSAQYCRGILEKFPFPRNMQSRIIDIVDNHHWFESYNKGIATAESVAIRCRRPEDFKIYEIMAKADLENINETFQYRVTVDKNMYDSYMSEKFNAIDNVLNKMYANANLVFDTQFMHGGDLFPTEKVMIDGVETELKVLNFNDLDSGADLQQFGFSKGVTKEDARFTVHMTDPSEAKFETVMHLTGNPSNNSVWSTSLIKDSDNITYVNRKFGFIFEVDQANISTAENHNITSGTAKGLKAFEIQMFKGPLDGDGPSTYVADKLYQELSKKGVDLTEAEYSQLVRQINRKKYTTQITKDIVVGDKTIKAADLVDALEKSRDALFLDGERGPIHSEIVSINPIVKGMIAKVSGIEQCPPEFLRFAAKHNLPIILMTATDSF